jgi:hypothetical protein
MDLATSLYPNDPRSLTVLFDLRRPGAEERLVREQEGWRNFARVQRLGSDHAILVMYPGGALRLGA